MTKFSMIATDYEDYVPREKMIEGLKSLYNQTFKDFELIIVHDGPKNNTDEYKEIGVDFKYFETDKHYGIYDKDKFYAGFGWGHHSRELGIKEANGEYIINFNIDNILYPDALQKIADKIDQTGSDVVIFACKHEKFDVNYFSGIPPVMGKIDMLQCVVSKKAWESIGGWHRYDHSADGFLFEEIISKYGYVHIPEILGSNR